MLVILRALVIERQRRQQSRVINKGESFVSQSFLSCHTTHMTRPIGQLLFRTVTRFWKLTDRDLIDFESEPEYRPFSMEFE